MPDATPPPGLTGGEGRTSAVELLADVLAPAAAVAVGAGAELIVPDATPPPGLTGGEGRTSAVELLAGALASAAAVAVGAGAAFVVPPPPGLVGVEEGLTSAAELSAGTLAPAPPVAAGAKVTPVKLPPPRLTRGMPVVPDTLLADEATGPASIAAADKATAAVPDPAEVSTTGKKPTDDAEFTIWGPAVEGYRGQTEVTLLG